MNEQLLGELEPLGGGDAIPLLKDRLVVGRHARCDIVLEFPNVSQKHCELIFENGYWKLADLGSRNGVKVNGERIESKWLQPGDEVSIAKHRYEIRYTPTSTEPPPDDDRDFANPFGRSLLEQAGLVRPERRPERPRPNPNLKNSFSQEEDDAARYLFEE